MTRILSTATLALAIALVGCSSSNSGGNGTVSMKMKVNASRGNIREEAFNGVQTDSRSFTPTSFKIPIMKISIAKADGTDEQSLYTCPGTTEAACLVDLQSQTALDAISAAATTRAITAGTYSKIMLATCVEGSSGSTATTAKVTGSGTGPAGGTWYTAADASAVVSIGAGTAQEADVGNWACSTKVVNIHGGLTVSATSAPLTLTVVVDNFMSAYFNQMTSTGQGGCKKAATGTNGFCVTYPAVMAYLGTDTATTKRFAISHNQGGAPTAAKANALIIVAATASGTPLMAYGRTYFTTTSELCASNTKASSLLNPLYAVATGGPTYVTETNADSFTVNANGTVAFEQGGSADTYAAKFGAFDVTATHSATVTSKDGVDTWNYTATLIP